MGDTIHLPVRLEAISEQQTSDLDLINRHTIEPVTLDDIYMFSGICSNDRLDSHLTKMDPGTTLRNYAEDLKTGISLLEGHDVSKNPYGRSYNGQLILTDGASNSVLGSWYIMRGLEINGTNTDHTIKAIKAGIIRDMSVGFGGTNVWHKCSSCGRDLWDSECPHLPGLNDEDGNMVYSWIMDARLREVSTVYKGSTPGAFIDKAREYVQQKQIPIEQIKQLEERYQVRLDDGKRSFYYFDKEQGGNKRMDLLEQMRRALEEGKLEKHSVYDALSNGGEKFRQPDDVQLRNELGDFATVDGVRKLKADAENGRKYVADLIDKAVEARTRAHGDSFNAEGYRNMLTVADMQFIKDEIRAYEDEFKKKFPSGRQTEPEDPTRVDDDILVSEEFEGGNK